MFVHTVPKGIGPTPLIRYVSRAYPMLNVRAVLKKRDIKVNGVRRDGEFSVREGDEIAVYANYDFSIAVAGEKDGLLAVVKPQGLPVAEDGAGIAGDTALNRVRLMYPQAQLCHRLDAQTGGVLVLALEERALQKALVAFKEHKVGKSYIALLGGAFAEERGIYRDHLVKDAAKASVRIVSGGKNALPVETRWQVLGRPDGKLTRMELEPVTGRTHQLRAHMAHYGHPILGDDKYGDRALNREYRMTGRLCLWCRRVSLLGAEFCAEAPDWLEKGKNDGNSPDGV